VGEGMAVTHWMVEKFFYERNLVVELAKYLPSGMLRRALHWEVSQYRHSVCHRLALGGAGGGPSCRRGWVPRQPHAHRSQTLGVCVLQEPAEQAQPNQEADFSLCRVSPAALKDEA